MKGAIPGRWQAYQEEHSGSDTLLTAGLSASLSWIRLHAPLLFGRSQQTRPDFAPLLPGWSNPATECCGSWTAEGNYYVFQSRYDDQSNIWALKESRLPSLYRRPIQVTAGPLDYLAPLPSHQPNHVFVIGARSRSHLSRYDEPSGQFRPYLPALSSAGRVELSRDGFQLAWINTFDGSLWQSKLDGTQRLQLTSPPMRVFMTASSLQCLVAKSKIISFR
jgi:hypothetical protein